MEINKMDSSLALKTKNLSEAFSAEFVRRGGSSRNRISIAYFGFSQGLIHFALRFTYSS